jgi:cobalt-zinc-cadmium efflux system protein
MSKLRAFAPFGPPHRKLRGGEALHQHSDNGSTGSILKWSLAGTVLFVVAEFVAGLQARSLALLSDAGHNLTDALALLLAFFGFYLQSKPPDEVKTFGYHRAGVLAAFVNALTLVVLSGYILYESYHRLGNPQTVNEFVMFWVAALGLLLNIAIMWGLHRDKQRDLNVRAAWLHMLGDALGSVGIIVGAGIIHYTGWQVIDPILSILIALLIIWTAWDIIKDSLNILLEGLPRGMRLNAVTSAMGGIDGVIDVHDLHIWSLGSSTHALSCHVVIEDMPPSSSDAILKQINRVLCDQFGVRHTTVQFEHRACALSENGCSIPVDAHQHHHTH